MNLLREIGSHLTGLEQLTVMMTNDLRPGIGETPGIRLIEVEECRVVLEATPDLHLYNPIGTVHGGFAATMLDFAHYVRADLLQPVEPEVVTMTAAVRSPRIARRTSDRIFIHSTDRLTGQLS